MTTLNDKVKLLDFLRRINGWVKYSSTGGDTYDKECYEPLKQKIYMWRSNEIVSTNDRVSNANSSNYAMINYNIPFTFPDNRIYPTLATYHQKIKLKCVFNIDFSQTFSYLGYTQTTSEPRRFYVNLITNALDVVNSWVVVYDGRFSSFSSGTSGHLVHFYIQISLLINNYPSTSTGKVYITFRTRATYQPVDSYERGCACRPYFRFFIDYLETKTQITKDAVDNFIDTFSPQN